MPPLAPRRYRRNSNLCSRTRESRMSLSSRLRNPWSWSASATARVTVRSAVASSPGATTASLAAGGEVGSAWRPSQPHMIVIVNAALQTINIDGDVLTTASGERFTAEHAQVVSGVSTRCNAATARELDFVPTTNDAIATPPKRVQFSCHDTLTDRDARRHRLDGVAHRLVRSGPRPLAPALHGPARTTCRDPRACGDAGRTAIRRGCAVRRPESHGLGNRLGEAGRLEGGERVHGGRSREP